MLVTSVSVLVLFLSLESSHGYYTNGHWTRQPRCPNFNKPCRLQVVMRDSSGNDLQTIETGTCTCNRPFNCSDDWSKPRHVVSRRLISDTHNMTLQMMFCKPIEPKSFCQPGEISLEAVGSLALPTDIAAYNCRCGTSPLVLKERSFGIDNQIHHHYVCAEHVNECERTSPCMTIQGVSTSTTYNCKCANGFHCQIPEVLNDEEVIYGHCNP